MSAVKWWRRGQLAVVVVEELLEIEIFFHLSGCFLLGFNYFCTCGGFTTFSTFCTENLALLRGGALLTAALYAALSLFVGLLAVYAGSLIARQ